MPQPEEKGEEEEAPPGGKLLLPDGQQEVGEQMEERPEEEIPPGTSPPQVLPELLPQLSVDGGGQGESSWINMPQPEEEGEEEEAPPGGKLLLPDGQQEVGEQMEERPEEEIPPGTSPPQVLPELLPQLSVDGGGQGESSWINMPQPEEEGEEEEAPPGGKLLLPDGQQEVGEQMEERPEEEIPPGTSPPQVLPELLPQLSVDGGGQGESSWINMPQPEEEGEEEEAPPGGKLLLPDGQQEVGEQMEERPEEEIPPGTSPPQVLPELLPQLSVDGGGQGESSWINMPQPEEEGEEEEEAPPGGKLLLPDGQQEVGEQMEERPEEEIPPGTSPPQVLPELLPQLSVDGGGQGESSWINMPQPEEEGEEEEAPPGGKLLLPDGQQEVGEQMEERPEEEIPPGTSPPQVLPELLPQLSVDGGGQGESSWINMPQPEEEGGNSVPGTEDVSAERGSGWDSPSVRQAFIRMVFLMLVFQAGLTTAILAVHTFVDPVRDYVQENKGYYLLAPTPVYLFTHTVLALGEYPLQRKFPWNIILLLVYTLAVSFVYGAIASLLNTTAVFLALAILAVVCVVVMVFCFLTKFDFTTCKDLVLVLGVVMVLITIITFFVLSFKYIYWLDMLVAVIGAIVHTLFLGYRTQLLICNRQHSNSPEEYVYAAFSIYVDIIDIFSFLLKIIIPK